MTSVRILMTLITLGAAGAGYVYLQLPPPIGEPYYSNRAVSFPWTLASFAVNSSSRTPVNDFVSQVHQRTRSVLDDFTSQRGDQTAAVVDNAFERLRKATQSTLSSSPGTADPSVAELADSSRLSAVPMPDFDELQRTAFESTEVEESKLTQAGRVELADRDVGQRDASIQELTPEATDEAPAPIIQKIEPVIVPVQADGLKSIEAATPSPVVRPSSNVVSSEVPKRTPATTVSNKVTRSISGEWKIVGKSTEGRPMHTMHLGDAGTRTFVIAGLNGDDRTGVRWLELLSEELRRRPELLQNNEVVFFRAGNPDGLMRNVRNNARGVPLNRNFPSRRYRPTPDMPPFAVPAGEVETRVMLETLYSFRPRRVIHLGATTGQSHVLYNRSAKNIGGEFERATKVNAQIFDSEQYPGSLEDFADGTLEAAVLSIRLSVENDWKQAWSKLQLPVLSAIVGQQIDAAGQGKDQQTDPDRTLIPTMTNESSSRTPRRRGYEELPPPPLR